MANGSGVRARRLWWAGPLLIVAGIVANLVVRTIEGLIVPIDPLFPPLNASSVVVVSIIGLGLATVAYGIVARVSSRPVERFRIVAVIGLVVSVVPDFLATPLFPHFQPRFIALLIILHVVSALLAVFLLPALTAGKATLVAPPGTATNASSR